MPLSAGARLGPYEILSALGAGGMGEVFRARDTKLNRDVAIKVLLPAVAGDPERLARFGREAQLLASLNHPNIGAIYGVEDADAVRALVMELVEGPTLADRIASGPIPLEEALPVARQIADALEAAHEQGIVHRDLKPANIKIREDGTVKVLDFGLAKALDPVGSLSSASMSPTLSLHATQAGIILGTAAYMSPEQAKGRSIDKRSDVWAFGCVVYEMLAGRRAFEGEDVTEIIASVVKSEPDWSRLPASVPDPLLQLVKRCLEKDRRTRVSDIAVARFVMAEQLVPEVRSGANGASQELRARARRRVFAAGAAGVIAGIVAMAAIASRATRAVEAPPAQPVRFTFAPPSPLTLGLQGSYRHIALSPDGSRLVYQSEPLAAGQQLVVRPLDQLELQPLSGIVGRAPFVSPDGRWIGYFTDNEMRKVSVLGGPPITICKMPPATPRGASWAADGTIIFAVADARTGLLGVPAAGGDPTPLTTPDAGATISHAYPFALPGGKSVLFTMASVQTENSQIAVLDLETKQTKTLLRGGTDAKYVNTGHLVFASAGSLRAVRFDLARLEVLGDPVPVIDRVLVEGSGAANYDVSAQGTLAYVPGGASGQRMPLHSLVWVNRQGREEAIDAPQRPYAIPRLSPDGTRVALDVRDLSNDIWILDLARKFLTPLNVDAAFDMSPVWTADGRRIIWASSRGGGNPNLYWQASDGTGTPERLTTNVMAQFPTSIAPDGTRVAFFGTGGTALDISTVALPGSGPSPMKTETLIKSDATKASPEISPDGHWIAYESNESGTVQVYVRPFPNVDDGRSQISLHGGTRPAWSRNGKELFYLDASDLLTSVAVQIAGTTVTPGTPTKVLNTRYHPGATSRGYSLRGYDVAADGQRFLMIKEVASGDPTSRAPAGVVIVVNWLEELKLRVPAK